MNHRITSRGLVLSVGLVLGACSFSTGKTPAGSAQDLIEAELAEQASMMFTEADCDAPTDDEVGTTFECTALNADGVTVTFAAIIDPDDMIFVAPSNLVYSGEMATVAEEAAATLSPEVGVDIDPADVTCPEETTVLVDDVLFCEIIETTTGDRYELTVTRTEFVLRQGFDSRFYEIGDLIPA